MYCLDHLVETDNNAFQSIQGGSKSKLLILSEYVNKTEKIEGMWTNTNIYRENRALSDIVTWIFYVTIVLYLNILWLKAVNSIKLLLGKLGMGDTDDITIYRDTKYSRYWYRIV